MYRWLSTISHYITLSLFWGVVVYQAVTAYPFVRGYVESKLNKNVIEIVEKKEVWKEVPQFPWVIPTLKWIGPSPKQVWYPCFEHYYLDGLSSSQRQQCYWLFGRLA